MGREEGGGFRMENTCFKIIKFKNKKKIMKLENDRTDIFLYRIVGMTSML